MSKKATHNSKMSKSHTIDRDTGVSTRNKGEKKHKPSPNQKRKMFKRDMKKKKDIKRSRCAENKFFELSNPHNDEEDIVLNWEWDDYLRPCKEGCMCWEFCAGDERRYEYECDCY